MASSLVRGYASRDSCPSALRCPEGARHGEPVGLHGLEKSDAVREEGTMMTRLVDVSVGSGPPHDRTCSLQRAARVRAVSGNTSTARVCGAALRKLSSRMRQSASEMCEQGS
jgi:hypothetical protein